MNLRPAHAHPVILSSCLLVLACALATRADNTIPPQSQVQQQQIKTQTQSVKTEIAAIIAEYQSNGFGGGGDTDEVTALKAIESALDGLSREQMEHVLALLRAARQDPDPAAARATLLSAIRGQDEITLRLQQQLLQYQRQQDSAAIALHFNQLADRQNANLRMLRRYAHLAPGATAFNLNQAQKEYLLTQVTEQQQITADVETQFNRLSELARNVEPATAARMAIMQQDATDDRLLQRLQASADELTLSQVGLAAIQERAIRDSLRRLAKLGSPPLNSFQTLRAAGAALAKLIQQEQAIESLAPDLTKPQDPSADQAVPVEEQQADIVDDTDEWARDITRFDPAVAGLLDGAILKMQRARAAILDHAPAAVQMHAAAARTDLQAALARLMQTMALLEKLAAAELLPDRIAALKDCIAALRTQQEQLAAEVAAAAPGAALSGLAARQSAESIAATDLVPYAQQTLPEIPELLVSAAHQMDMASQSLGPLADPPAAHTQEISAISSLKQAEDLLDARASQLAQAKKDFDALERARQRLAWAILQQERVAVDIEQADLQHAAAATPALAERESALGSIASEIQQLLAARVPPADAALALAETHLSSTTQSLRQPDAHAALPLARAALADLDAARKALDPRLADLANTLQVPVNDPNQLNDLARAIDQVTSQLQQPPDANRDAIVALRDQQRQIAAELQNLPAQTPPTNAAAQAASRTAERLDRNELFDATIQGLAVLDALKLAASQPQTPQLAALADRQAALNQAMQRLTPPQAPQPPQVATHPTSAPAQGLALLPVTPAQAAQLAGDLTFTQTQDRGTMPEPVNRALAAAEQALADANAQAAAGDQPAAQAARARALQALAQAQNAVATAQKQNTPGTPNTPTTPQIGPPNQPAPNTPLATIKPGTGMTDPANPSDLHPPGVSHPNANGTTASGLLKLPPRDRAAIEQSRHDQYPQEYAPAIESYFKNLSEQKE